MNDSREARLIAELQERLWEAANRADLALLERLIAEDFLLVEADSLVRKGKREFLREIAERSDEERLVSFELRNVKVQLGSDLAVAYGQFTCEDEIEGERLVMNGNAVDVFARREGEWRLTGSVYGEVPAYEG